MSEISSPIVVAAAAPEAEKLSLTSHDPNAERLDALRELFPEAFSEGVLDTSKLAELIGQSTPTGRERYGLSWAGKAKAHRAVQSLSTGTLRPAPDESVNFDTTENLIIEGDNLEVLKLLQKSYSRRAKMIYIDPPYNTGNEFIYPDNFREGLQTYLEYSGQVKDGVRQTTNSETSGRYHSNWLNMMYPRLFLARNLLKEDGVIFVSIDDHEVNNLRLLMNEIFGEENFIAEMVWEKTRKNDAKLMSVGHEYILLYARSLLKLKELKTVWREAKPGAKEIVEKYRNLRHEFGNDDRAIEQALRSWYQSLPQEHPSRKLSRYKHIDANGPWRDTDISWPGGGGPRYDVIHPVTNQPCAVPERGWRFATPESMQRQIDLKLVEFRKNHTEPPIRKAHIIPIADELIEEADWDDEEEPSEEEPVGMQVMPSVIYKQAQVSVKYLRKLMNGKVFDNPKDHEVLARLIRYCTLPSENAIILDFFAGSGSTAEAIMQLNATESGNRHFVLVQLPEPTPEKSNARKAGYERITEVTKERVRRVIAQMNEADAGTLPIADAPSLDRGFKVFKLDSSNFKVWDADNAPKDAEALAAQLLLYAEHLLDGRSQHDVLYELLLKSGRMLTVPIDVRELNRQPVYSVPADEKNGTLLICLEIPIKEETLREMIALAPGQVLCLDSAFEGNDQLKNNIVLQMKDADINFRTV
jgi:adenine-specific DNA-methyltransferase